MRPGRTRSVEDAARRRSRGAAGPALTGALVLALLPPAPAHGQAAACGAPTGASVSASAAAVRFALATGANTAGLEAGLAAELPVGGFVVGAGAGATRLDASGANLLSFRLRGGRRVVTLAGIDVCASLLGGAALLDAGDHDAWSLAGGPAVVVSRAFVAGATTVRPFAGVRGLAGRTRGTVLGEDVAATGLSVGGEGGVEARAGRSLFRLTVTADGLDAGLGPTAFPALAIGLSAGWRF